MTGTLPMRTTAEDAPRIAVSAIPRDLLADLKPVSIEGVPAPVALAATHQRVGGARYWLVCPNCSSRRSWLAVLGSMALCRRCARLPYAGQCLSDRNRRIRRARQLYDRIGVSYTEWDAKQGPKPAGMHWRTYWRLYDEARALDPCPITETHRRRRRLYPENELRPRQRRAQGSA